MFEKKQTEIRKLAEKYIDSCTQKTGFVILPGCLKEDFIDLFVAGFMKCLEINKPNEWHDLRKNPDDLPKKVGNYVVCYLDTMHERHTFELSYVDYLVKEHWVDVYNHNIEKYDEGVIAWCEIPKFEVKQ